MQLLWQGGKHEILLIFCRKKHRQGIAARLYRKAPGGRDAAIACCRISSRCIESIIQAEPPRKRPVKSAI